jgi:hypothetical protein
VEVLHRSDYNYSEVADRIKSKLLLFSVMPDAEIKKTKSKAAKIAGQALWKHFIGNYLQAYSIALKHAARRQEK